MNAVAFPVDRLGAGKRHDERIRVLRQQGFGALLGHFQQAGLLVVTGLQRGGQAAAGRRLETRRQSKFLFGRVDAVIGQITEHRMVQGLPGLAGVEPVTDAAGAGCGGFDRIPASPFKVAQLLQARRHLVAGLFDGFITLFPARAVRLRRAGVRQDVGSGRGHFANRSLGLPGLPLRQLLQYVTEGCFLPGRCGWRRAGAERQCGHGLPVQSPVLRDALPGQVGNGFSRKSRAHSRANQPFPLGGAGIVPGLGALDAGTNVTRC